MTERRTSLATRLFVSSRPLSWINTAYPFAVAVLATGGAIDAAWVIGTLFFLVPYNLLMYGINDVFDYASDLANPRKGGVEGALLPAETHRAVLWWSVLLPVPFVVALALLGSPLSWLVLAIVLFFVVAYSAPVLRFKERPVLDSFTSAMHFMGPAAYGLSLTGHPLDVPVVAMLVAFTLWGMASHAFGAVQDVIPDREGGISSVATVLGARWTVRAAITAWIAAGALMLLVPFPGIIAAVFALPYVWLAWPYRNVSDADSSSANGGWRRFLAVNFAVGFGVTMLFIWWAFTL